MGSSCSKFGFLYGFHGPGRKEGRPSNLETVSYQLDYVRYFPVLMVNGLNVVGILSIMFLTKNLTITEQVQCHEYRREKFSHGRMAEALEYFYPQSVQ